MRPLPTLLAAMFLLLATATAFIFAARAVQFDIEPAAAKITITSGWPTWKLGERFLMLPGDYKIHATFDGYSPLNRSVTVGDAPDQDFRFKMQKLPGILAITTEPEVHARVYLDQAEVGTTPLTIDSVTPGLHDIRVLPARYLPYDTDIDITGKRVKQAIKASLTPAWANITITSLPDGADITADGKHLGKTPASVELLQGSRTLKVSKPGYKIWQSSIDVDAGKDRTLAPITLVRADGTVTITTRPPGANVTIGGRYRGQSPLDVNLAPGEDYDVLLTKVGYEAVKRKISVAPEQDLALDTRLQPVLGIVELKVEPAGGELFIDGESRGKPGGRLQLTARKHSIRITHPGYADYTTVITPQPGMSQQLLVKMQTKAQAAIAAIADSISVGPGIELKLVLPGELVMGAGRREPGRRSNEIEKHVKLTHPYYLGVNEITNAQYRKFSPGHNAGSFGRALLDEDDRPVVNVSWEDAVLYCNWLSQQAGLPPAYVQKKGEWVAVTPMNTGYRLPTEAEWAWAARYANGAPPTRFPWGDNMPPVKVTANYADESARNMVPYVIDGYDDHYRGPSPVGSFPANALGIHDLAGNVSEWINDVYSVDIPKGELTDPMGPETGEYHVIRGSNYQSGRFSELRWTFRDYGKDPRPDTGFRVARYVK